MKRYTVLGDGGKKMLDGKDPYKCRKWQLRVNVLDGERGGKERMLTRTFPSSAERREGLAGNMRQADAAIAAFVREIEGIETTRGDDATFAEYAAEWLDERDDSMQYSPRTSENYRNAMKAVCELIGDMPLREVDARTLDKLWADLRNGRRPNGRPLSPNTVVGYHAIVKAMLHHAIERKVLPMDALLGSHAPKGAKPSRRAMTDEEAAAFLERLQPNDARHVALMMYICMGLRRSEALRVEWKDYDGSTIDVYDNLADDGTPIGRPKTPASVARVPVPEFAADFLAKWRVQQARIFDADGDTPICSWDGSFIKPEAMSVWWQRESAKWGVPYTMHELRHTFITLLARAGVHPRTMQELARQATLSVTMEVYTHVQDAQKRDAVAKIGILGKK